MKRFRIFVTLITVVFMSTGCEVDFFTKLQNDIRTYNESNGGIQRSAAYLNLQTAIQTSQSKHDGATEGTSVGNYTLGTKAPLQSEINSSTTVLNNPVSTDTDYDTARTTLTAANTTFDARVIRNLDIVFLIDTSGSMTSMKLNAVVGQISNSINNIGTVNTDTKFAVIRFTAPNGIPPTYEIRCALTTNKATFLNELSQIPSTSQGTQDVLLPQAVELAANNLSWTPSSDRILIVILDSPIINLPTYVGPDPSYETTVSLMNTNNLKSGAIFDTGAGPIDDTNSFFLPLSSPVINDNGLTNVESEITTIIQYYINYWP